MKKWVNAQRDEFEIYDFEPAENWDQLSSRIAKESKKRRPVKRWLSIAAAVVVLLMAGALIYPSVRPVGDPSESIFSGDSELAEARNYYTSEINVRLVAARKLVDDPSVFRDLDELDKAFAELKNDLKDNADNEEVIIAMMENYQLKLKILDRILSHLKEKEVKKNKSQNKEVHDEII